MLTAWRYKDAGAKLVVFEEFFNQEVERTKAVLSLSTAPDLRLALWKLTWTDENVNYELYATDMIDERGNPSRAVREIVKLASSLVELK